MKMGYSGFLVKCFLTVLLGFGSVGVFSLDANDHFISDFDMDDDQQVSREEFTNARRKKYDETDEDKNDSVDEDEYVSEYAIRIDNRIEEERKGHIKQTHTRFEALDKNESTSIEWAEYKDSGDRSFNRFDTNKNLLIDDTDEAPQKRRRKDSAKSREKKGDSSYASNKPNKPNTESRRKKNSRRVISMPTTHRKQGMLDKYDVDGDGIVEYGEFNKKRRADFDRADENKNGALDKDEYLYEYLNRLDLVIENTRKKKLKQAGVRFGALDIDDDEKMTFEEYQISGMRRFECRDSNADGVVMASDQMSDALRCQHGSKKKDKNTDGDHKEASSTKPSRQAAVTLK